MFSPCAISPFHCVHSSCCPAESATEKLKDTVGKTSTDAKAKSEELSGDASEVAGKSKGKAEEALGSAKGKAEEVAGEAKGKAKKAAGRL